MSETPEILIPALRQCRRNSDPNSDPYEYVAMFDYDATVEIVDKLLEQLRWIPVSERLPDERVAVNLADIDGGLTGYGHYCDGVWYTAEPQPLCETDVTHWREIGPLPEGEGDV